MSEQENYTPTLADEALQATLLTGHVCLTLQQEYANGNIADLAAYNRLYEAARKADGQVRKLFDLLEQQSKETPREPLTPGEQGRISIGEDDEPYTNPYATQPNRRDPAYWNPNGESGVYHYNPNLGDDHESICTLPSNPATSS